jgi:hypothetical protein
VPAWWRSARKKTQLEDELRQEEKRMLRLRLVFAAETDEFRETLLAILGVKVAFYDNAQVRVTSQNNLCAAFVFQPAPRDVAKDGSGSGGNSGSGAHTAGCAGRGTPAGVAAVDEELGRN